MGTCACTVTVIFRACLELKKNGIVQTRKDYFTINSIVNAVVTTLKAIIAVEKEFNLCKIRGFAGAKHGFESA